MITFITDLSEPLYRSSPLKVFLEISQNSQENTYVRVSEKRDKKRLWRRCFPAIRSTLIINLIHYQIGFKSQLATHMQAPEMICSGLQLLKKEISAQVFYFEYCETFTKPILKNICERLLLSPYEMLNSNILGFYNLKRFLIIPDISHISNI